MPDGYFSVAELVAAIEPFDDTERAHQADALAWLDWSLFLVDHILAGLWLPPGGHVEPGEDPADTARREAHEELGIDADLSLAGARPVMVTMTLTREQERHTDVSLWYLLAGSPALPIELDRREFTAGRWRHQD